MSRRKSGLLMASALVGIVAIPAFLYTQESSTEVPSVTIRTNTRLVLVDVVVRDKKGQPIMGLKADDFLVEENGKRQHVAVLVPPGGAQKPGTSLPPGLLSNHPEHLDPGGPLAVMLLDAVNSPFNDQAYGRLQMLKYVQAQSDVGRQMAVMTLTDQLHVVQQFTSDPQILITAIKNYKPQAQPVTAALPPPVSTAAGGGGSGGPDAGLSLALDNAAAAIGSFEDAQVSFELERRTIITIQAMQSLARLLAGLPGRKDVVWLSADMPFDLIPEQRNISEAELMEALPSVKQKSLDTLSAGSFAAEQRRLHGEEIQRAQAALATAGIAIYPIDLRGLMSGMEFRREDSANRQTVDSSGRAMARMSDAAASQETMREIATETGGKAYVNQNEIQDGVKLAMDDDKASYTIGYYPENKKWDGKYRSIKVKVNRDDVEVRARKGYFAIDSSQTRDRKDEQQVATALQLNAPATQVLFMGQAKPTDPGKVRVLFLVDGHTLTAEDSGGKKKMNVSLYATFYGSNGKMLADRSIKVEGPFDSATYQQILDKGMMVPLDMDLPAGATELRLAVLDNKTGFIGTASGPVGQ
jgi:VWFA-related protein